MPVEQSGLVLDCNTADPLSWDGVGPQITNTVSGATVHLDLYGSFYSAAAEEITMIYDATGNQQTLKTSGFLTIGTVMMYLNRTTLLSDQYLLDARNDISNSYIILSPISSTQLGPYWSAGTHYVNGVVSTAISGDIPQNEYCTVAVTSATLSSGNIRLMNGNGKNMDALFGRILIYDRVLTATEVLANHVFLTTVEGFDGIVERPLSAVVTLKPVAGATSYALSYQSGVDSETYVTGVEAAITAEEDLVVDVTTPETLYTLTLYVDGVSFETATFTTLANTAGNYDTSDYLDGTTYDLTGLSDVARQNLSEIMNDLFTTGDDLDVVLDSGKVIENATFVNEAGTLDVTSFTSNAAILPFDTSIGAGQDVNLTISTSTENVTYDHTANSITVEGTERIVGESFILDGRKVTVENT